MKTIWMLLVCAALTVMAVNVAAAARDFSRIDAVVSSMPPAGNVDDVVRVISRNAQDDWEKARGAYVWVARNIDYDVDEYFRGSPAVVKATNIFQSHKAICYGYSDLYSEIARKLGLQVQMVHGYAKGYAYKAGVPFDKPNHAWNAVMIDGKWRLLDSTWGAGYVEGTEFVRHFSDFWFDTDPQLFFFNHFPDDVAWLLLEKQMSLDEYVQHPMLESQLLERLVEKGYGTDHVMKISRQLPLHPLFESYTVAFVKNGGKHDEMLHYLSQGDLPAMWAYEKYPMQLVSYPNNSVLKKGQQYDFSLRIPNCDRVVIINNSDYTPLERHGDLFVGKVMVHEGKLSLAAEIDHENVMSYWPVIDWDVK